MKVNFHMILLYRKIIRFLRCLSNTSWISVWIIYTQSISMSIQIHRCQIKARIVFPVEQVIVVVGLNWYVILLHSKRPRPGRSVSVTQIHTNTPNTHFCLFFPTGSFTQLKKTTRWFVTETLHLQWTVKLYTYLIR